MLLAGAVVVLAIAGPAAAHAADSDVAAVVVDGGGDVVAEVSDRDDADEVLERAVMKSSDRQLHVEYVYRSHGTVPNPPNDPLFGLQWNFDRVGIPHVWTDVDGSGVVVAVLDSAVNFTGIDGFCSTVVAPYDALRETAGLADLNTTAEFGHGTHVAGTIAQCTNNGKGVAGAAPGALLMPVRVLDDAGTGTSTSLARGIDWAVDHGARVINVSLGAECASEWPACDDPVVDAAIARAISADVFMVASAGNAAASFVSYPAAHPGVVAVGAVGGDDKVWVEGPDAGSNHGTQLDLVAPGTGVLQETTEFGLYRYVSATGTSMAAPHVAGAAALILDADPLLTSGDVSAMLTMTATDIGLPGFDVATGWGRLDVDAAVAIALAPAESEDPCEGGPCDSIATVNDAGVWRVWDGLYESADVTYFYYGDPGDVPFMGDWDGDGVATPGLYRRSDGFVYLRNSNTQGVADLEFLFGDPNDVPLVGDFNGDGRDSVSIWRPDEARVFVMNELGADGEGLGAAEFDFYFGDAGDTPFVGDFDGDGIDTIGLRRESTGFVYLTNTLQSGTAEVSFFFGDPGDLVFAGDWDGDGDDTVGVYRPANGKAYLNLENTSGTADWERNVGTVSWVVTARPRD